MKLISKLLASAAILGSAAAFAIPAQASTIGAGVQLAGGTYIGTKGSSTTPDPFTAGTSRTYQVKVTNTGSAPQTMPAFAGAAQLTASGTFTWPAPSPSSVNTATGWNTAAAPAAPLAPGASEVITVTVSVPASAAPGTYYAVLWAGPDVSAVPGKITLAAYAGIREYITVK